MNYNNNLLQSSGIIAKCLLSTVVNKKTINLRTEVVINTLTTGVIIAHRHCNFYLHNDHS